jgi:hypothetical protein
MAAIAAGPVEVVEPDSPEQVTSGYWRSEVNIDEARRRTPASQLVFFGVHFGRISW